jgi:L-ascorbate metabolism protein UlaG (beta-lactamase superfamily)
VRIAPVHHASIFLRSRDGVIHIDPSGDSYYAGAPAGDLVLITGGYDDHFDPVILPNLCRSGTVVFGPAAAARESQLVTPIHHGEKKLWRHWEIEAVPAYNLPHGAAPGRPFHEKGEGIGYVLSYAGKRFYVSGNTGNTPELRALDRIDVAFLPMSPPYTMTAAEAADAARVFKPKTVYPYHYRGNPLGPFEFKKALADTGIEIRIRNWYQ